MANALDYITWRGDLSFEVAPINEVDVFLMSQIAMVDFRGIVSRDAEEIDLPSVTALYFGNKELCDKQLGVLQSAKALPSFKAMGKSKRYSRILLSHHVNYVCDAENEQFSATVFRFSPEVCAVVYRGTDDSIIGWKEDCNLAIYDEVPAQRDALRYLTGIAKVFPGKLIVAGHSKGGNLAVYAASNAGKEIQDRIVHVFNYDGPGFSKKFISSNNGYLAIKDKISTIVSQNSIVGMLLETPGRIVYTRSVVDGPYAHDGFTWEVEVNHFKRVKGLSKFSRVFDEVFTNAMEKMGVDEKKNFVNEVFDILFESGANTLTEFKNKGWKTSLSAVTSITGSKVAREFFNSFLVTILNKSNEEMGLTSKNEQTERAKK